MKPILADVPEEAVSIINKNIHVLPRKIESGAISNILLPTALDPFFHEVGENSNGEESTRTFSRSSTDDDDSISAESFYSTHENEQPTDSADNDISGDVSLLPKKIIIRGMAGIGKSTLAAIVACRQDIREAFDFICWVNVGKRMRDTFIHNIDDSTTKEDENKMRNNLNYDMYRDCLRTIYKQLMSKNVRSDSALAEKEENFDMILERFAEEVVCSSGDASMKVAAKQVRAMFTARSEMAQMLNSITSNTLIILDDVWCEEDIDLFNFYSPTIRDPEFLSILVTTRKFDEAQLPATYSLSLGVLNEPEGVKLLGWELGLIEHFDFNSLDISDKMLYLEITKKCGYSPLAIRMLGRSIKCFLNSTSEYTLDCVLKHAMMGWDNTDFGACNTFEAKNTSMFVALDRTFFLAVPTIESSNFLKLCFGALAVAFTQSDSIIPWISLDIVLLLWTTLLESQGEDTVIALRKDGLCRSIDVCKILKNIGAVDTQQNQNSKRRYIRLAHGLLWEFGKQYLEINFLKKFPSCRKEKIFFSWLLKSSSDAIIDTPTTISRFLNKQVATIYEELTNGFYHSYSDDGHIFLHYPQHIIKSNQPMKAFHLLNDRSFISTRLHSVGIEKGTQKHMYDIDLLYKTPLFCEKMSGMHKSNIGLIEELVRSVVFAIVTFDNLEYEGSTEMSAVQMKNRVKARGLVIIGAAIQKYTLWNLSMECFSKALQYLKLAELPSSYPEMLQVIRYINTATLYPLHLVPRDSDEKITLKHAASLREGNLSSGVPLVLSSHPGRAIVPVKNHLDELSFFGAYCFLGIGAEESVIEVFYDGKFITRAEDGAVMNVALGWVCEGAEITIKPGPTNEKERLQQLEMTNRMFIINEDGTVSVASHQHFVLGLTYYPKLYLVDQFSPNRAIFKNAHALVQSEQSGGNNDEEDVELELISHPGYAIAPISVPMFLPFSLVLWKLGLGPQESALKVVCRKRKVIFRSNFDLYLSTYFPGLTAGNPIILLGSNSKAFFKKLIVNSTMCHSPYFVCNNDGSISPLKAPHLALGFQVPNFIHLAREPVSEHIYDSLKIRKPIKTTLLYLFSLKYFFDAN